MTGPRTAPGLAPTEQLTESLARRSRHCYVADQYPAMARNGRLGVRDLRRMREEAAGFGYRPKISVLLPVYDPERAWLERALDSVLAQTYDRWELCVCDDASTRDHVRETLSLYGRLDGRVKVVHSERNGGISAATNEALSLASGEYVALLDHDDELTPDALFEVAKFLQMSPEADLVYTDVEKVDEHGEPFYAHFKPDWSPDLLSSSNFVSHLGVYRTSIVRKVGGFREGFEGAQDFDLVLRFVEETGNILHIPKVLYRWRTVEGSLASGSENKPYIRESGRRALREALDRRGIEGTVEDGLLPNRFRVRRKIAGEPRVSLVVAVGDDEASPRDRVESVEILTRYRNSELVFVENGGSGAINRGVREASGEYVVLLGGGVEAISDGWLEAMLEHVQRPEVGAVGARLLYPDGRIWHAGIVTGVGYPWRPRVAANAHQHYPEGSPGYAGYASVVRNVSAVTAACMMVRKTLFEKLGGLDEVNLRAAYNDVDLCLRMREEGYLIVYTPHAELRVHEPADPDEEVHQGEFRYMRDRWGEALDEDPYYNPNFSTGAADFNLRADLLRPETLRTPEMTDGARTTPPTTGKSPREQAWRETPRSSRQTTLIPRRRRDAAQDPSGNGADGTW